MPVKEDGTKAPDVSSWKQYQSARPTNKELRAWFNEGTRTGMGLIMGEVSGFAECIDFDSTDAYTAWLVLIDNAGFRDLADRVLIGYGETTPNGMHLVYRCPDGIEGNQKLAMWPGDDGKAKAVIETRGEAGFIVSAPSHGTVHASGAPYVRLGSGIYFDEVAVLTAAERDTLLTIARQVDRMPVRVPTAEPARIKPRPDGKDERPGDRFERGASWADILEPHGWRHLFTSGVEGFWQRPGQPVRGKMGATTNYKGSGYFYVFSTSVEGFETEQGYGKFRTWAILNHGGDWAAAARALADNPTTSDAGDIISSPAEGAGRIASATKKPSADDTRADGGTAAGPPPAGEGASKPPPSAQTPARRERTTLPATGTGAQGSVAAPDPGSPDGGGGTDGNPLAPAPYDFAHIFPPGHFVRDWIEWAYTQTDAALDYHEAGALVALATLTPGVRLRLSAWGERGLGTNLYIMLVGSTTSSRKSTSAAFVRAAIAAVTDDGNMPDRTTPEAFLEQLARRSNKPALWIADEFGKMLKEWGGGKTAAEALSGILLTAYDGQDVIYARHSKRVKGGETVEDVDRARDPHLSMMGLTTDSIFAMPLDDVLRSGMLPRYGIVMPSERPKRRDLSRVTDDQDTERERLYAYVRDVGGWASGIYASHIDVALDDDALALLNDYIRGVEARASDIEARLGPMALKVAMLAAVGEAVPSGNILEVKLRHARMGAAVADRWQTYAVEFESRMHSETEFERTLERCLAVAVRAGGEVSRRDVSRAVKMPKRQLSEVQDTLVERGLIQLVVGKRADSVGWKVTL